MAKNLKKIGKAGSVLRKATLRANGLARRLEIRRLVALAGRQGQRVWLAGGAVRDLILGRKVLDADVVVTGDAEELARELERSGAGRSVALSREPPRVFRVARRGRDMDLAEITGGSIERDLGRRDFTVNAIAFDFLERRWIDPFGGVPDLAAGTLRMVSARNLVEDPLRALRAARLIATHRLLPEPATTRACRAAAPGLARVAPERIRAELVKLLEAPRASAALLWACRSGVLTPALDLSASQERRLAKAADTLDLPALSRRDMVSRRRLRLAFLFGRLGFSAETAASRLAARRFGREEIAEIVRLLASVETGLRARGPGEEWAWVYDAGPLAGEAALLLRLLEPGKRARAARLARRFSRRRLAGPRVTGADVIEWLGVAPGPQVGRLLREVRIEILRGAIRSRVQARRWLRVRGL